jgi:hypothetical protein
VRRKELVQIARQLLNLDMFHCYWLIAESANLGRRVAPRYQYWMLHWQEKEFGNCGGGKNASYRALL